MTIYCTRDLLKAYNQSDRDFGRVSDLRRAISAPDNPPNYEVLNVPLPEFERTLSRISTSRKKCLFWLGSSVRALDRARSITMLANITETLLNVGDLLLVGVQGSKDYSEFNVVLHANKLLGQDVFLQQDWNSIYLWNPNKGSHEPYIQARRNLHIDKSIFGSQGEIVVLKGENVRIDKSHTLSSPDMVAVWEGAGLVAGAQWDLIGGDYCATVIA